MKRNLLFFVLTLCSVLGNFSYSQTNWIKYPLNPVLSPGLPGTYTELGFPFIYVMEENDTMKMWYSASDINHNRIGYAWSTDYVNFEFTDEPLFEQSGVSGTFDDEGVSGASVLKVNDQWYMWFNGNNVQPYFLGNLEVGLATSDDGKVWTRYSEQPVLHVGAEGSWDSKWAYCNTVLIQDGIFKMWYSGNDGYNQNIGYATSDDGINWTKYGNNPLITTTMSNQVHNARVLFYGGKYHMWYNMVPLIKEQLYYSTSSDGIIWSDPVEAMQTGEPGSFDADWVWHPSIFLDETGVLRMWYTGYSQDLFFTGYATDSTMVPVSSPANFNPVVRINPNPAINSATVSFSIPQATTVNITILSLTGKQLRYSASEYLQSGTHSRVIDVSDLMPGIYLCKIRTEFGEKAIKLVVGKN